MHGLNIYADFADGLRGVRVQQNVNLVRLVESLNDICNLAQRLDGPHLVVGVHDGYQGGRNGKGRLDKLVPHESTFVHFYHSKGNLALAFQLSQVTQDSGMFDSAGDNIGQDGPTTRC